MHKVMVCVLCLEGDHQGGTTTCRRGWVLANSFLAPTATSHPTRMGRACNVLDNLIVMVISNWLLCWGLTTSVQAQALSSYPFSTWGFRLIEAGA